MKKCLIAPAIGLMCFTAFLFSCTSGGGGNGSSPGSPGQNVLYPISLGSYTAPAVTGTSGDPLHNMNQAAIPAVRQAAGIDEYLGTAAASVYAAFDSQAILAQTMLVSSTATTLPAPKSHRFGIMRATGTASLPPTSAGGWTVSGDGTMTIDFGSGNTGQGLAINLAASKDGVSVNQNVDISGHAANCPDAQGRVPGGTETSITMTAADSAKSLHLSVKGTSAFEGHVGADGAVANHDIDYTCAVEVSGQQLDAGTGAMVPIPTQVYRIRVVSHNAPSLASWDEAFIVNMLLQGTTGYGPKGRLSLGNPNDLKMFTAALCNLIVNELQMEEALKKIATVGCGSWSGTTSVTVSDSAPTYKINGLVTWATNTRLSTGTLTVYNPEGTLTLEPILAGLSISPATYTLTHADGELRIDSSTDPPTYIATSSTQPWSATWSSAGYTWTGPAGGAWLSGEGSTAPGGASITGSKTTGGCTFTFTFTKK